MEQNETARIGNMTLSRSNFNLKLNDAHFVLRVSKFGIFIRSSTADDFKSFRLLSHSSSFGEMTQSQRNTIGSALVYVYK